MSVSLWGPPDREWGSWKCPPSKWSFARSESPDNPFGLYFAICPNCSMRKDCYLSLELKDGGSLWNIIVIKLHQNLVQTHYGKILMHFTILVEMTICNWFDTQPFMKWEFFFQREYCSVFQQQDLNHQRSVCNFNLSPPLTYVCSRDRSRELPYTWEALESFQSFVVHNWLQPQCPLLSVKNAGAWTPCLHKLLQDRSMNKVKIWADHSISCPEILYWSITKNFLLLLIKKSAVAKYSLFSCKIAQNGFCCIWFPQCSIGCNSLGFDVYAAQPNFLTAVQWTQFIGRGQAMQLTV
jgi:hypothetical protein